MHKAMQLQLCVRDPAEAAWAVRAGAAGVEVMSAAPETIRAVVARLRLLRDGVVVGAGIGPLAAPTLSAVRLRARRVVDCGVDCVRVPVPARPASVLLITQLGQLAQQFKATDLAQHDVRDDDLELRALHQTNGVGSVADGCHRNTGATDRLGELLGEFGIVLDQQDLGLAPCGALRRSGRIWAHGRFYPRMDGSG